MGGAVSSSPVVDARAVAEALADVLVERGLLVVAPQAAGRVLDAAQVAAALGRNRQWVYAHALELGAFRYGDGPRARLGFDAQAIERWKRRCLPEAKPTGKAQRRIPRAPTGAPFLIPYEGSGRGA